MSFNPCPLKQAQWVLISGKTLKLVGLYCFSTTLQTNTGNHKKPYHRNHYFNHYYVIFDKSYHASFLQKLESFHYNTALAITQAICDTFYEKLFNVSILFHVIFFVFIISYWLRQYFYFCFCNIILIEGGLYVCNIILIEGGLYAYFLKSIPQQVVFVNFTKTNIFHFFSFQWIMLGIIKKSMLVKKTKYNIKYYETSLPVIYSILSLEMNHTAHSTWSS